MTLLALPVLTRLYSPEDFGVLSFVVAVAAVAAPTALLRLEAALLLPESVASVRPLVHVALVSVTTMTLLIALALSIATRFFPTQLAGLPNLQVWLPLTIFFTALLALQSQLVLRERRYGLAARRNLVQSIAISGGQLALFATRSVGFNGLVAGTVAGSIVGNLLFIRNSLPYVGRPRWTEMKVGLRRYWRFPVIFAPTNCLVLIGQQAPLLFVVFWFGIAAGGQVGLAERLVAVPLALLGISIGNVLDSELSKRIRESAGGYDRLYLKTSAYLLGIGCAVALFFGLLGPTAIVLVFGPEWQQAADASQVMAITAAVRMVVNPTRRFLSLFQRGKATIFLELGRLALVTLAILGTVAFSLSFIVCLWSMYLALAVVDAVTWIYGSFVMKAESRRTA